jgi:hydroxypyruvate isomerase
MADFRRRRVVRHGGGDLCGEPGLGRRAAAKAGLRLCIEPIDHRDMPGSISTLRSRRPTSSPRSGRTRWGCSSTYHCQTTEGDVTKRDGEHLPIIAHMQLADVPARNEPGTGEIGWPFVFRRIDELGYQGWVGCEYRPAGDTVAGLAWRKTFGV